MTENTQKTDRTLAEDDLVTQPLTQTMAEQQAEKGFWVNLLAQGLWRNNPAIVQLLGLCPLLAVSNSATNALGLGLATLLVLIYSFRPSTPNFKIACGVLATGNSLSVALFTPLSVA